MTVRNSPWLNERAELLVKLVAERHGMTITMETARENVSDRLDHLAETMRVGRRPAKQYITSDVISTMADRIGRQDIPPLPQPSRPFSSIDRW